MTDIRSPASRVAAGEGGAGMTTQTRVLPELDEALDFDPTCEHPDGCADQASWLCWTAPCRCLTFFVCDHHKREMTALEARFTRSVCRSCSDPATMTWRPL